jgi:hypothetical protein
MQAAKTNRSMLHAWHRPSNPTVYSRSDARRNRTQHETAACIWRGYTAARRVRQKREKWNTSRNQRTVSKTAGNDLVVRGTVNRRGGVRTRGDSTLDPSPFADTAALARSLAFTVQYLSNDGRGIGAGYRHQRRERISRTSDAVSEVQCAAATAAAATWSIACMQAAPRRCMHFHVLRIPLDCQTERHVPLKARLHDARRHRKRF